MSSTRAQKQCRKREHTVGVPHAIPEILIFGEPKVGRNASEFIILLIQMQIMK